MRICCQLFKFCHVELSVTHEHATDRIGFSATNILPTVWPLADDFYQQIRRRMTVHDPEPLTEIETLLVIAASVLGMGPQSSLVNANTYRIINQVLDWRGMSREQIREGWNREECGSSHDEVYSVLIRMTAHPASARPPERPGAALFEGRGNWGDSRKPDRPACRPHYNSCRLTDEGERIARQLLELHPEYGKKE